jgi:hypothetical protein
MSPDSYVAVVRERFLLVAEDTGGIVGFAHLNSLKISLETWYLDREQITLPLWNMDVNHNRLGKIETEPRQMKNKVEIGEDPRDDARRQDRNGGFI